MYDLTFKNFSVRNGGCIEYADLNLQDQGLVLVRGENLDEGGSNGSGKTTLFDLLSTTLTGSSGKGARKNDYLPLTGGGNLELLLQFERLGHQYDIRQYRKHKEHGTCIMIFEDGVDITPTTKIDDVQKFVLSKSGLTEREWYGSIYLTQQHSHALVTGTPKEKKEYLAAHFGLNEVDACIKINEKWVNAIQLPDEAALRELLQTCEDQLTSLESPAVLAAKKTALQAQAKELSTQLVSVGVEIRSYEAARTVEDQRKHHAQALAAHGLSLDDATRESVDDLRKRIAAATSAAQVLKSRETVENQLNALELTDDPDVIRHEMSSAQDEFNSLSEQTAQLSRRAQLERTLATMPVPSADKDDIEFNLIALRKKVSSLEASAKAAIVELDKLRRLEDQCPTCLRTISAEEKAAMAAERQAVVQKFDAQSPEIIQLIKNLESDLKNFDAYTRTSQEIAALPEGDLDRVRATWAGLKERTARLSQQLSVAMTRKRLFEQLASLHIPEAATDISNLTHLQTLLQVVSPAYEFMLKSGGVRFSQEALALSYQAQHDLQAQYDDVNAELGQIAADEQARIRLDMQKADIEGKLKRHSAEKQRKRVLEVLQVVLKDVKARALRDCTEMLRSALPLYVRQLFPQGDVAVELAEEEDSLDFYLRKGNSQIPMSLVSGGQAKRVGLAVLFAFAKLGAKTTNVLIADEPYKDLDVIGRECAFELFTDLGIPSVFVTSHDQDQLREKRYDKTLVMRMQGGRSRLVEI